jgi:hypothetical protein
MEFPISALQCVTVTPTHFFVVPRQGTDLIIPRRGLNAQQTEALLTFGEAVAFSSLHIDNLPDQKAPPEKVGHSFMILRWSPLVLAIALPFTLGNGLIHSKALWYAFVGGMLFLSAELLYMRTQKVYWIAWLYLLPIFLKDACGISGTRSPEGHFLQWLLLMFLFGSLPVFLFPRFFCRLSRLPEAGKERHAQA